MGKIAWLSEYIFSVNVKSKEQYQAKSKTKILHFLNGIWHD